jgi:protein-S-isoprenylcysteine O-methyltransferase Ste14
MKLVADWRKALKWFSIQIPAANAAFLLAWAALPEKFQNSLPPSWVVCISVVLLVAGMFGRLVQQGDDPA